MADDVLFVVERNDFVEELWASWHLMPVIGSSGVFGHYNTVADTTAHQLSSRRLSTLLGLGQCTSLAVTGSEFWEQVIKACEPNAYDIPFAVVYAQAPPDVEKHLHSDGVDLSEATSQPSSEMSSSLESRQWVLEGTLGLPDGYSGLPARLDFAAAAQLLTKAFNTAITTGAPVLMKVSDGSFPPSLRGVAYSRAYGVPCDAAVLFPVAPSNRENIMGFVLVGINPRLPYNADYQQFFDVLARQCATSLASVLLIEEEFRRSKVAAALAAQDRIRLSEQLAISQQEAIDSETRFRNMADLAPVGMYHLSADGRLLYANQEWQDLTRHPKDLWDDPMSWEAVSHPDDRELLVSEWSKLAKGESVAFEFRLNKPFVAEGEQYVDGERVEGDTWVYSSAYADLHPDGSVRGLLGCLTEISKGKWIEGYQERRIKEAMELKRQQENFIDMISHEARNPLSAILLCTESILASFGELLASETRDTVSFPRKAIESHLESADIIMACALHQKRIIDDVLTLSKLDAELVHICPVPVQPAQAVRQALKMFDGELQKSDIELDFAIHESYWSFGVDWVRIDPSRLLQVLINLFTNAIKFTRTEARRRITVTLGASSTRPSSSIHGVPYISSPWNESPEADDPHFLQIEVADTGRGITEDEMTRLFQRFQQASPKTHVEYGGSGLGLFISRELTRMQGGAIGVSSSGKGATFAFYVSAAPCVPPAARVHTATPLSHTPLPEGTPILGDAPIPEDTQTPGDGTSSLAKTSEVTSLRPADGPLSQGHHVLVVEDNLINQKVMRHQLERVGCKVVGLANHGLEALEMIRKSRYCRHDGERLDIILLDFEMPVLDGISCVRRIREMEANREIVGHIPVIGVTANARAEQQEAAIEAGMTSVITKPFKIAELLLQLDRVRESASRVATDTDPA